MSFKLHKYQEDACVVYGFSFESTLHHNNMAKVVLLRSLWDRKVLKVMKIYFKDDSEEGESAKRRFLTEAAILASAHNPFIMGIEALGSFPDYNGYLMPYYEDGTLTRALPTINQEMKDEYLVQLCSGIKYLRDRGVAHRDLKTDNILLINKKLVIADFGLADLLDDNDSPVTDAKGTIMYISPEQYENMPFDAYKVSSVPISNYFVK
jgi:serine/threonine protein kinase